MGYYDCQRNSEYQGGVQCGERNTAIDKIHPYVLRHTYLTRLYNIENDLRFVQDQVGHSSPISIRIYMRTNNMARKRQVEALDNE